MTVTVLVATTSPARFVQMHHPIHVPVDSPILMDIDYVQVLFHLSAIGMQIIGIVLILIILVAHHVVVDLAEGNIQADIETIHPLTVVEEKLAGFWAKVLIDLVMVQGKLEAKVYLEVTQMYGQEMVIGCAWIHYVTT